MDDINFSWLDQFLAIGKPAACHSLTPSKVLRAW
jgi:hypothetical protein